jgi:hypothetical protein
VGLNTTTPQPKRNKMYFKLDNFILGKNKILFLVEVIVCKNVFILLLEVFGRSRAVWYSLEYSKTQTTSYSYRVGW